jgi:hypothetical protein
MATSRGAALGGRDGGRLRTGGARGNGLRQPAVRRRVLRRSCQSGRAEYPRGRLRPLRRAPSVISPAAARYPMRDHAPDGARRAQRALEDV